MVMDLYFKEICKFRLLNPAEEQELWELYKKGRVSGSPAGID